MKCILTPNPNSPYNLRQISPAYGSINYENLSEDEIIQHVIDRNKEVGVIPVDAEYWIMDISELPDDYFFDAWEWED